ncbi:MAG: cyclic nucleotide-binding domain-containing protein [Candidatus Hadarchaeum sp.]
MVTVDQLRTCELFSELTNEELEQMLPFAREESYKAGTVMFSEGDEATTFYILQEGKVSLQYEICPQPDYCQDATILLDKPGDFMGWSSLVKPRRMTASGLCLTDVRLIAIDGKKLNELLERDSHMGFVVMKELAGQINKRLKEAKGLTFKRLMGSL